MHYYLQEVDTSYCCLPRYNDITQNLINNAFHETIKAMIDPNYVINIIIYFY